MRDPSKNDLSAFQIAVLVLSSFVLLILAIELFVPLNAEISRLVNWIDDVVCVVLLVDFGTRLYRAESKLEFLRWGWIDLLASVPAIESLRWGRAIRMLRILRLIRALRSIRALLSVVFKSRATGGMATITTVAFLTISVASMAILYVEQAAHGNIRTAEDALWWSFATVTTVGYGDVYPVSNAGRGIAAALMIVGVGLFGTLSGAIASVFLGDRRSSESVKTDPDALTDELQALRREIAELRAELERKDTGSGEIERRGISS